MLENVPSIEQIPRGTGQGELTRRASGFTPTPSAQPVGRGAMKRLGRPTRFRGSLSRLIEGCLRCAPAHGVNRFD